MKTGENWLILQILTLLYHRVGQDRYTGPLGDLLNSELEFLDIDGNRMPVIDFCQQYDPKPTVSASMLFEGSNFKYLQENVNGDEKYYMKVDKNMQKNVEMSQFRCQRCHIHERKADFIQ